MSASDKKKLRKEQATELLTQKQRQEQADAKKLKIQTTIFVAAMVLILAIVVTVLSVRAITNSGIAEKTTIAATIGDEQMNSVVFNYYYNDAINDFYNEQYELYQDNMDSALLSMGLDTKKPLNEQYQDAEQTKTWADYFIEVALDEAKRDYALSNDAKANGFELSEEEQATIDSTIANMTAWATAYGYTNNDQYMRAMFGNGSTVKNYREYYERCQLADSYYDAHLADYSYTDEEIRAYESEEDRAISYTSFSYDSVYLSYTNFYQGGTENEDSTVTYSDEEKDAARAAMKVAAESVAAAESHEDFSNRVEDLEVTDTSSVSVSHNNRSLYSSFAGANADMTAWLTDESRVEGDMGLIPITNTVTEGDQEIEQVNGYFVLRFEARYENTEPMGNVRHLLVKFEGGQEDEATGETVYTDEEKAAAKEEADGYLKTWLDDEKTEDSFIALVQEHSDDTSAEAGGLFEDINPDSSYVPNFLSWSTDPNRQAGDAEVIETEYGYHVMYYVGDDEMTYRDYMIHNDMAAVDQYTWYENLLTAVTATVGDTSKIDKDIILNSAS